MGQKNLCGWVPALILTIAGFMGCASPATQKAMMVNNLSDAKRQPFTVSVVAQGGSETGAFDLSSISNQDLAAAIEESIKTTRAFSKVMRAPGADYELTVTIVDLARPVAGFDMTVEMEAAWSLVQSHTGNVVMRRPIKSSGRATMGDEFGAVNRLRVAVERAARENIRQGLAAIGTLELR